MNQQDDELETVAPDARSEDEMTLDAPELAEAAAQPRPERPPAPVVDDPNAPLQVVSLEDNINGLCRILEGARRDLAVFTRHLDPRLYDDARVLELMTQLGRSSPFARLRFLVMDAKVAASKGSKLLSLGRSLSSYFEFRKVHSDHEAMGNEFIVVDEAACLYRPQADRYEGLLHPHDGLEARLNLKTFNQIWEKSEPDPDLRQMKL